MIENHDTFFERIRPFFAPSVTRKIELAYILAKYAHRAQTRKEVDDHGAPVRYFEHVWRATLVGIDLAKIVRLDTICASVLHDTFEDTRISPELIEDLPRRNAPVARRDRRGHRRRAAHLISTLFDQCIAALRGTLLAERA